jgi:hypothetical protein
MGSSFNGQVSDVVDLVESFFTASTPNLAYQGSDQIIFGIIVIGIIGLVSDLAAKAANRKLFPWLTVRENICFGLRERGMALAE